MCGVLLNSMHSSEGRGEGGLGGGGGTNSVQKVSQY